MDFLAIHNSPEVIANRTLSIYRTMLRESRCLREANFKVISVDDLARLFRHYDKLFFDDWLSDAVACMAGAHLSLRLSATMTRAGGKTIRRYYARKNGVRGSHYEIAIATRMLFMNFREAHRPVTAAGLLCNDRLEALQRIMEHEILHLVEMLAWGKSSCAAPRFKSLATSIFGHTESRHNLITAAENAAVNHAIKIGGQVEFELDGEKLAGIVNRIHHRATVLVEADDGLKYRNGKKYRKYYIPLPRLRAVVSNTQSPQF